MDIKRIKKPLKQYRDRLTKHIRVDQLIVFGSYLEGTARKNSDIDVIVVSDDFKGLNEDQRWDMLYPETRYIEPDIESWGFTNDELKHASPLSTLGHARTSGIRVT